MEDKIEEFFRDATADDVARVMRGEKVEARFRDQNCGSWVEFKFLGGWRNYHKEHPRFLDQDGVCWVQCQVYDPPEILKSKPDPGEGWRLVEKFPPEELQKGDEAWGNHRDNEWSKSDYAERGCRTQCEKLWYRRRIANNPETPDSSNSSEIPNSSRSRDTIPSGWRVLGKDEERLSSDAFWSLGCKEWIVLGDDRVGVANREKLHAIRQVNHRVYYALVDNYNYRLPNGQTIRVAAKGFEVG
jgi:hypothetical protein